MRLRSLRRIIRERDRGWRGKRAPTEVWAAGVCCRMIGGRDWLDGRRMGKKASATVSTAPQCVATA
jgi:hypothetical protein